MIQHYVQMGVPAKGPSRRVLEEVSILSGEDEESESGGREYNGTMSHSQDQPAESSLQEITRIVDSLKQTSEDPDFQQALGLLSFLREQGFAEEGSSPVEELEKVYLKLEEWQRQKFRKILTDDEIQKEIESRDIKITQLEANIDKVRQRLETARAIRHTSRQT